MEPSIFDMVSLQVDFIHLSKQSQIPTRLMVEAGETPITSTAGAGTFAIEFGVLSRLTGDWSFEVTQQY